MEGVKGLLNLQKIKFKFSIGNPDSDIHVRHVVSDQKNWNKLLQSSGRNLLR